MHKLYIVVGSLIVIALGTALAAPLFIDWNVYRSGIEAEASRMLGLDVRVKGAADARLLPVPSLTLNDVEIGPLGAPALTVERLALNVELSGLLSGEVHVVDAVLERPRLRLTIDRAGKIVAPALPSLATIDPGKVSFASTSIVDGALSVSDLRSQSELTFTQVNVGRLEARSLAGPWRGEGSFVAGGTTVAARVSTARLQGNGDLGLALDLTPTTGWPVPGTLSVEGTLHISDGEPALIGRYAFGPAGSGVQRAAASAAFHSAGGIRLDTRQLLLSDFAVANWLTLPKRQTEQANDINGDAAFTFGATPRFDIAVRARQIDLDRALGDGPTRPANVGETLSHLRGFLASLPQRGVAGSLNVDIPGIVVGGGMVQALRIEAETEGANWTVRRFEAGMPGRSTLAAVGTLALADGVRFDGDIRIACDRPPALAAWWRGRDDSGPARRLAAFDLASSVQIAVDTIHLDNLAAHMDGATFTGRLRLASGQAATSLVDLTIDRLDVERAEAVVDMLREAALPMAEIASNVDFRLAVARIESELVSASGAVLEGVVKKGDLALRKASVDDLAGARIVVSPGDVANAAVSPRGRLTATVSANSLATLAALAESLAPDWPLTGWLKSRSAFLGPANLTIQASRLVNDGSVGVSVSGNLGSSTIGASIALEAPTWPPSPASRLSVALDAGSTDPNALAAQFGLAPILGLRGPAELRFRAAGALAEGYAAELRATLPGSDIRYSGVVDARSGWPPRLTGSLDLTTDDFTMFLAQFGASDTRAGGTMKASATLTATATSIDLRQISGSFQGQAFSGRTGLTRDAKSWLVDAALAADRAEFGLLSALLLGVDSGGGGGGLPAAVPRIFGGVTAAPRGTIALSAGRLDLGGLAVTDAALTLGLQPEGASLRLEHGGVAGGVAKGDLVVRAEQGEALVTGEVELTGADIGQVVAGWASMPVATGKANLSASLTATGRTLPGLIGSLSGSGSLALRGGALRGLGVGGGLDRIIAEADGGTELNDEDLADRLVGALEDSAVPFAAIDAPFRVAGGKVFFDFTPIDDDQSVQLNAATVDLAANSVRSDWTVVAGGPTYAIGTSVPQIDIRFEGPISQPTRRVRPFRFGSYLQIRLADQQQRTADRLRAGGIDERRTGGTPGAGETPR
ncbi:MAG: AsmA family protein [Bauldia sp.]